MIQHTQRTSGKRSVLRKVAWPVLMCSMVCVLIARPAVAEPTDFTAASSGSTSKVPDQGVLPVPDAPLTGPATNGQTGTGTTTVTGPYASQIMAQYSALELTGEDLKQANSNLDEAKRTAQAAYQTWQTALANATRLQEKADNAASEAYKDAAGLGPYAGYATDVHQLSMLAPGLNVQTGQDGSVATARDAKQAKTMAATDEEAYRSAFEAEQRAESKQSGLQNSYDQQSAALNTLRATNETQLEAAEAVQAATDQQLGSEFGAGTQVNGMIANPKARAALNWAYNQSIANPPKWYKFGAEGPDYFDCSGLTWASYFHAANYSLPRIAAQQYHATSASQVSPSKLLPGDLLFFSTTSRTDWTTISHVAIYYGKDSAGNDLMVEAAHEGTHVRVHQVWWSAFFGATRVFPAVPAPGATPTTGAPTPSTSPSHGSPSTPPTGPSTPPTSTPPSDPSQTPSPTPTPTPSDPTKTPTDPPSTPATDHPTTTPPATDPTTPSDGGGSSSPTTPSTEPPNTPSNGDGSSTSSSPSE